MSLLLILLPPAPETAADWAYVLSADGRTVSLEGRCAASLLPRANRIVGVLDESSLSWHRLKLPKVPASRLQAAIRGMVEEALLDEREPGGIHMALLGGTRPAASQDLMVAAADRQALQDALAALQAAGLDLDAVVACTEPLTAMAGTQGPGRAAGAGVAGSAPAAAAVGEAAVAHVRINSQARPEVVWATAQGVAVLPWGSAMLKRCMQQAADIQWTCEPAASRETSALLGREVPLRSRAQHLLQAAEHSNLLQFDLAPTQRGLRRLGQAWKRWQQPQWQWARRGLMAVLVLQLLGWNAWAWQQRQAWARHEQALSDVLLASFPQVKAVIDAPVQMQREVQALRAQVGQPGPGDLQTLLDVAASAWPEEAGLRTEFSYSDEALSWSAAGWSDQSLQTMRQRLQGGRWVLEAQGERLRLKAR